MPCFSNLASLRITRSVCLNAFPGSSHPGIPIHAGMQVDRCPGFAKPGLGNSKFSEEKQSIRLFH